MALRLGEYVVYGELRNRRHYSTHGVIVLRGDAQGRETVLHIELTGNCDPDLQGKWVRFSPGGGENENAVFRAEEHPGLQERQIGPTGTMTAQGWVRTLPCPVDEFVRRVKLGEPPPSEWKRRLYLEWYGQNGRVIVEMADALVEECVRVPKEKDDEGEWMPLPNTAPSPGASGVGSPVGPDFTIFRVNDDGVQIERWAPPSDAVPMEGADEATPNALQRELDAEASAIERAIRGESHSADDDTIRELELMDYCMEYSDGQPVASLLGDIDHLPLPDELDDEAVETQLKVILARLALIGVALDVCEHFTPRDCYRLLRDTILPETNAFDELAGTGWVQHMMTHEYCKDCQAEFEDPAAEVED